MDSRFRKRSGIYSMETIFTGLVVVPGWSRSTSRTRLTEKWSYQRPQQSSPQALSCKQLFRLVHRACRMTHRNPNLIPVCSLHELLLSLLLPVPPRHSLAHLVWPASHPSQLFDPHSCDSGAPGSFTSHMFYAQSASHSHRRSPTSARLVGGGIS